MLQTKFFLLAFMAQARSTQAINPKVRFCDKYFLIQRVGRKFQFEQMFELSRP